MCNFLSPPMERSQASQYCPAATWCSAPYSSKKFAGLGFGFIDIALACWPLCGEPTPAFAAAPVVGLALLCNGMLRALSCPGLPGCSTAPLPALPEGVTCTSCSSIRPSSSFTCTDELMVTALLKSRQETARVAVWRHTPSTRRSMLYKQAGEGSS